MTAHALLQSIAFVLVAGLAAAPLALLLRIPNMVVLLAAGVALGKSGAGVIDLPSDGGTAQLIFTLGVSVILFHGGLRVRASVVSRTIVALITLALPGILITAFVVALVAAPVLGIPFPIALLAGAVLAATDPAVIVPLFDRFRLRPKVAHTVIAESAFNDPTATLLTIAVAGTIGAGGVSLSTTALDFSKSLAFGGAFGVVAGLLLVLLTSSGRAGIWRESPAAAVLGVVALMYFTADRVGGSAYLGAFVMGVVVSNMPIRPHELLKHRELLDTFVAELSEIATIAVFVTLGSNLPLAAVWDHLGQALVVVATLMFVARPLTVAICLSIDRRGKWTWREAAFVAWCRETGVVPAALASLLLSRGVVGAETISAVVAVAVCATLLLQATSAEWVARRLQLLESV